MVGGAWSAFLFLLCGCRWRWWGIHDVEKRYDGFGFWYVGIERTRVFECFNGMFFIAFLPLNVGDVEPLTKSVRVEDLFGGCRLEKCDGDFVSVLGPIPESEAFVEVAVGFRGCRCSEF